MKRFRAWSQSPHRVIAFSLALMVLWGAGALVRAAPRQTGTQLQRAEERRAAQLRALREAEAERLKMLSAEKSILPVLEQLGRKIEATRKSIAGLQRQVADLEKNVRSLEREIADLTKKRDARQELVAKRLRANYKINYLTPNGFFALALRADNLADMLVRLEYVAKIREKDDAILKRYLDDARLLRQRKTELEARRQELVGRQTRLRKQEAKLAKERREQEATLATVRENRALKERAIRETNDALRRLENLITRLEARKKAEERAVARQKEDGTGPPSASVIGSTERIALMARRFGKIRWPVEGKIVNNVSSALEGITIQSPPGTPVKAVLDGTVEYAEWFNGLGFGKLVVLNHGQGYRSFYAHLQDFSVQQGDRVRQGQTIGTVGSTGSLVGPVLYFEMRQHFDVIDFKQVAR